MYRHHNGHAVAAAGGDHHSDAVSEREEDSGIESGATDHHDVMATIRINVPELKLQVSRTHAFFPRWPAGPLPSPGRLSCV